MEKYITDERTGRDILPPLDRSGGFLLNAPNGASINKLFPRVPRFFCQQLQLALLYLPAFYAMPAILLPSSLMLIAAFRSLSMTSPHSHR